jgi:hypothetical protein
MCTGMNQNRNVPIVREHLQNVITPQGTSAPCHWFLDSSYRPETSVRNYHHMLRNIQEQRTFPG